MVPHKNGGSLFEVSTLSKQFMARREGLTPPLGGCFQSLRFYEASSTLSSSVAAPSTISAGGVESFAKSGSDPFAQSDNVSRLCV